MDVLTTFTDTVLSRLLWTSAQAVILIAAVGLINRLLPRLSAAVRCALWWLVGAQLIIGLCWSAPLELPLLTAPAPASISAHQAPTSTLFAANSAIGAMNESAVVPMSAKASVGSGGWTTYWRHILLSIWLAALIAQTVMAIRHWRCARRLLRESHAPNKTMQLECEKLARKAGLRTPPTLRLAAAIGSPQVIGLWHPVVLLPSDQPLTSAEMAMALSHEMAHLRRGDLWLGWIPVVAQRLFFFHPLVLWAMREYALQREAACDEQVLQQIGSDPQAYGQLLLRLGVIRAPHAGLAGASPTFQNLKRRLIMLQQNTHPSRRSGPAWLLIALIALIGVLPYRVTAGSADQTSAPSSLPAPPVPPPAPPMQPPPAPPALPHAPPPPPPSLPPAPPAPPAPPMDGYGFSAKHVSIHTTADANEGFAMFNGDTVTIDGSRDDVATAKRLLEKNEPMMWFRRGDKAWVIRDQATMARAKRIYQPISQLAERQGKLAGKQGEIAGRQAGMAARSAGFAAREAALAQRQAQLATRAANPAKGESVALAARRRALQAEQDSLSRQQNVLQAKLDVQQRGLDKEQANLSRQQDALSARQGKVSQQASLQITQLIDAALAKGLARPASIR